MRFSWRCGGGENLMRCCITPTRAASTPSEHFQRLLSDNGITCSMSRTGNVWDNAAMESFFSSLKTERTAPADAQNTRRGESRRVRLHRALRVRARRHSTNGYLSPMEYEMRAGLALPRVSQTGSRPIPQHAWEVPIATLVCKLHFDCTHYGACCINVYLWRGAI